MPRAIPANMDDLDMLQTMFGFQEGTTSLVRKQLNNMLLNNMLRQESLNEKPPVEPSPYDKHPSQCLVRSVKLTVFLALVASLVIIITFDVVSIKHMLLCMLAFGCGVFLTVRAWKPLSQWLGLRSSEGRRLGGRRDWFYFSY